MMGAHLAELLYLALCLPNLASDQDYLLAAVIQLSCVVVVGKASSLVSRRWPQDLLSLSTLASSTHAWVAALAVICLVSDEEWVIYAWWIGTNVLLCVSVLYTLPQFLQLYFDPNATRPVLFSPVGQVLDNTNPPLHPSTLKLLWWVTAFSYLILSSTAAMSKDSRPSTFRVIAQIFSVVTMCVGCGGTLAACRTLAVWTATSRAVHAEPENIDGGVLDRRDLRIDTI